MPWGAAAAIVGSSVISGIGQSKAGKQQQQGYANANGILSDQYGKAEDALKTGYTDANTAVKDAYGNTVNTLTPYAGLGLGNLNQLMDSGYLTKQFSNADLNANMAPNYSFGLEQGQRALNAANNATGGAVGGNAQQALAKFNNDYAQNAYQKAFENYNNQRQNIVGNSLGIANMGQSGSNALANAQTAYGSNLANLSVGQGQNLSSLYTGLGGALAGNSINAGNAAANTTNGIWGTASNAIGSLGKLF